MDSGVFKFNFGAAAAPAEEKKGETPILKAAPTLELAKKADDVAVIPGSELIPSTKDLALGLSEQINIAGVPFPLYKNRVSDEEAAQITGNVDLQRSDLVAGVYEGGFKLWECSIDMCSTLCSQAGVRSNPLASTSAPSTDEKSANPNSIRLKNASVLELGCGHALPGIVAALAGASVVHLADYNPEVLRSLTVPNVQANLVRIPKSHPQPKIRYFAGDWASLDYHLFKGLESDCGSDSSEGYDLILTAETIYSLESQQKLIDLFKKVLKRPSGVVLLAAKTYYFGVGGSLRGFEELLEKDGSLRSERLASFDDGSSNLREILRITWK